MHNVFHPLAPKVWIRRRIERPFCAGLLQVTGCGLFRLFTFGCLEFCLLDIQLHLRYLCVYIVSGGEGGGQTLKETDCLGEGRTESHEQQFFVK